MSQDAQTILLIGFGNPGRLDDGLGPAFAERVEQMNLPGVVVDSDYQLTVEDGAAVAEHAVVIFADASTNCKEPYSFEKIEPEPTMSFSSHSISPQAVLGLAHDLFKAKTRGYLLGIRGYEFDEFGQKLSGHAKKNLDKAVDFFNSVVKTGDFDKSAAQLAG